MLNEYKSSGQKVGIPHLSNIYKEKGRDFIKSLFSKRVTINEKLDASAFGVERNPISGGFDFYKRNSKNPITKIDRTLMRYYEKPIEYFNSFDKKTVDRVPFGWRFGMEYFANERPQLISYDRVPKNNLVLSYIHVKDSSGKVLRTIEDKAELDGWARVLGIEEPPIIFQGFLSEEQKDKILSFLDTPAHELIGRFKSSSFANYIISVLNPGLAKTTLNNDLQKNIEGIVFRFGEGEEQVPAKIVDPVFELLHRQKNDSSDDAGDVYYITILDMMNFISLKNLQRYKVRGKTYEDRYISLICKLFNDFVESKGKDYTNIDFAEPDYLKKPEFDVNYDMITDERTLELVRYNDVNKKLFKIMLASFRKRRKKQVGIFTQGVLLQFNSTVSKIEDLITGAIKENEIPTFGEFLAQTGRNIMIEEDELDELEKEGESEMKELTQAFKSFEDVIVEDDENEDTSTKKVNIVVGRFQPFHNGHLRMIKDLRDANGLPCVVVIVNTGNRTERSPFDQDLVKSMVMACGEADLIIDCVVIKRGFIQDIVAALKAGGYIPMLWGSGSDRSEDYKKQVELNFKQKNKLKLPENFQIMETSRKMSGQDVRLALKEERYEDFKKMTPKPVHGFYMVLVDAIKKLGVFDNI